MTRNMGFFLFLLLTACPQGGPNVADTDPAPVHLQKPRIEQQMPPSVCGNGILENGEDCDDGNTITEACSPQEDQCEICTSDCSLSIQVNEAECGNGIVEFGETCDDGNAETESCAYGLEACTVCDANCDLTAGVARFCGDGFQNVTEGELCDDANADDGDGCGSSCQVETGYACAGTTCEPICGDGIVVGTETCDDGNNETESCDPQLEQCDICNGDCVLVTVNNVATCGNGVVEIGEACDDHNTVTENCDPYISECVVCSEVCEWATVERVPVCGDGFWESPEQCDDGNLEVEDCAYGETGCTVCGTTCDYVLGNARRCGDGQVNVDDGESCDDGNQLTESCAPGVLECEVCDSACETRSLVLEAVCGNGILEGDELCDQGATPPTVCEYGDLACSLCDAECQPVEPTLHYCGDGVLDETEACDDANLLTGDGCGVACEVEAGFACDGTVCQAICGDGFILGAETCDDGNTTDQDGCSGSCLVEHGFVCVGDTMSDCASTCGDQLTASDEGCDDGAQNDGDGCTALCEPETGYYCDVLVSPAVCSISCGDGVKAAAEACDDGNLAALDGCNENCEIEQGYDCSSGVCVAICGDGLTLGGEVCDDGNLDTGDGCDASCSVEFRWACVPGNAGSLCSTLCGNGELDYGEACDVALDPNGCSDDCLFEPFCGDGLLNDGESCDDGNTMDEDGCDANCMIEEGFQCHSVNDAVLRRVHRLSAFDAAGPFVYWADDAGYVERLRIEGRRWERQRIAPDNTGDVYVEDLVAAPLGALLLTRHIQDEISEKKLWWVQGQRWGAPDALFPVPVPDVLADVTLNALVKKGDTLVLQGKSATGEAHVALVGWRHVLAPDTCLAALTSMPECRPTKVIATGHQFTPEVVIAPAQNMLWLSHVSGDEVTSSRSWVGIDLAAETVDVPNCADSDACFQLQIPVGVRSVAAVEDYLLVLAEDGVLRSYDATFTEVVSPYGAPEPINASKIVGDGHRLWAVFGGNVLPFVPGLGTTSNTSGVGQYKVRRTKQGWVSAKLDPGGLHPLRQTAGPLSHCTKESFDFHTEEGDMVIGSLAAGANRGWNAGGYVSGSFAGHPTAGSVNAAGRDGWLMGANGAGQVTLKMVAQSVDSTNAPLEVEDRTDWVTKDPSTGDLWVAATFCKNAQEDCAARWLRQEGQTWVQQTVTSTAEAGMIALLTRLDAKGTTIHQTYFGASNLKFMGNTLDRHGNIYVTLNYQGALNITSESGAVFDLPNANVNQSLVIKIDRAGAIVWTQELKGDANVIASALAIYPLATGEQLMAVSGWFKGQLHPELGNGLAQGNEEDGFVALFRESDGALAHERTVVMGAEANNRVTGIAAHPDGSFWITGWAAHPLSAAQNGATQTVSMSGDEIDELSYAFVVRLSQGGETNFGRRLHFGEESVRSLGVQALDRGGAMVWLYSDGNAQARYASQVVRMESDGHLSWRRTIADVSPFVVRPVLPAAIGLRDFMMGFQVESPTPLSVSQVIHNGGEVNDEMLSLGAAGLPYQRQTVIFNMRTMPFDPSCTEATSCVASCGDGFLGPEESCDDGNNSSLDGCSSACEIEPGFVCFGERSSVCQSLCGDGLVSSHEVCDDGNLDDGDGCNVFCRVEPSFVCVNESETPSLCTTDSSVVSDCEANEDCVDSASQPVGQIAYVAPGCAAGDCDGKLDRCQFNQVGERLSCGQTDGACSTGFRTCTNDLVWSVCVGAQLKAPEICDGLDNDCDGDIDEGIPNLRCGTGACANVVAACSENIPQTCEPLDMATTEVCNGLDDDCDGEIDEDLPALISCGTGACEKFVPACVNGIPGYCEAGAPLPETCDGQDNDCNGEVDDLPEVVCGRGACLNRMVPCEDGAIVECEPLDAATDETCNGLDDDCDSFVDEGLQPWDEGDGVCRNIVASCEDGASVPQPEPLPLDVRERCNRLDDDCDGVIDENLNCDFRCELYRESNVCCNNWFYDRTQEVGASNTDTICTSVAPEHPCCNASVQNYNVMLSERPNGTEDPANPCCDLAYEWPNFSPRLSNETRFMNEVEFSQTCIGGRVTEALPDVLGAYVAANEWNSDRVEKDLLHAADNPCQQEGEAQGLVSTWTWNADRGVHESGIGEPCGLYVRFYDEDFSETGPRVDVHWDELGTTTATATEDCRWGTKGYSYSQAAACGRHFNGLEEADNNSPSNALGCDAIWEETPAYYQYLMPIPEDASGFLNVKFDITDADADFLNRQLSVVAFDVPQKNVIDVQCEVQSYVDGVPVFTWDAEEQCALIGGTCDGDSEKCVHDTGGCVLKREVFEGDCALAEMGTELFFRRIANSAEAYGDCRSLSGTAFCDPNSEDSEACPDNPLCDDLGSPEGMCNDASTQVEMYYKATGCWVFVLDETIRDAGEENVYGLDDNPDDENSSYHSVLNEAERLTACCQGDVEGCCGDGETGCDDLSVFDGVDAIVDANDATVTYLKLKDEAETTCNNETATYLKARFDVGQDGRKKIAYRVEGYVFGADFKAGNELPRGYIYDGDTNFVSDDEPSQVLTDHVSEIEVVIGETFELSATAFDDDSIRQKRWRLGDGISQDGNHLSAFYLHPTPENSPHRLRFEVTDRNEALNWPVGSLGIAEEERGLNTEAALDIVVKETPDWLSIDTDDFEPALDNAGVRAQRLSFSVASGQAVGGFELSFNPREPTKKKGTIVFDHQQDTFVAEGHNGGNPWFELFDSSEVSVTESGTTQVVVDFSLRPGAYSKESQFENWIYYRAMDEGGLPMGRTDANPEGWFLWPLDFDVLPLQHDLMVQYEASNQTLYRYFGSPVSSEKNAILVSIAQWDAMVPYRKYRLSHNWVAVPVAQEVFLPEPTFLINYGDGTPEDAGEPHLFAIPDGYTLSGTVYFGDEWEVPTTTTFLKFAGDWDGDGLANYEDPDNDNDGYCDKAETVEGVCTAASVCEDESDAATCSEVPDAFPMDTAQWTDKDGDGFGDNWAGCDTYGLRVPPTETCRGDDFPGDPNENRDVDGDGIGDNEDPDDDNDGLTDVYELYIGSHPELRDSDFDFLRDDIELEVMGEALAMADSDGDGLINILDRDSDGDGVFDGDEEGSQTDYDGDGKIAIVDPDSDNDTVLDGDDSVPVGWPGSGMGGSAGNGPQGGAGGSIDVNHWRADLPAGFIETEVTFHAYGIFGEASRLEHPTELCWSLCGGRCLSGKDPDWVINRSTSSVYVSNSDMSHSNIKAEFEAQLEETEWELEGDIELNDYYLEAVSEMSWGGTSGCHPNEFKFTYDHYTYEYKAKLRNKGYEPFEDPVSGQEHHYRFDTVAVQNYKENKYVFEMTLDHQALVRDLGASDATLLMRYYLVSKNYDNNTVLSQDAVFHEATVAVRRLTQQTGSPLFTFEVVVPRDAVEEIALSSGQSSQGLFTAGLLLYPMAEIEGGQNDGAVAGFNFNQYAPKVTGVVHNTGGLHMRLITKRVSDTNQVASYFGFVGPSVGQAYVCQEDSDCSQGFCDNGQCSDTVVEPGRLQANIYGLTFDDAEAWPSSNKDRVDEILGWQGKISFADGTRIYVVNGLNGQYLGKPRLGALTLGDVDGILILADHASNAEAMKLDVFRQSDFQEQECRLILTENNCGLDLVACQAPRHCRSPYEMTLEPEWFEFKDPTIGNGGQTLHAAEVVMLDVKMENQRQVCLDEGWDCHEGELESTVLETLDTINTIGGVVKDQFGLFTNPQLTAYYGYYTGLAPSNRHVKTGSVSQNIVLSETYFGNPQWDKRGKVFADLDLSEQENRKTIRNFFTDKYTVTLETRPILDGDNNVTGWRVFEVGNEFKRTGKGLGTTEKKAKRVTGVHNAGQTMKLDGFDEVEITTLTGQKKKIKVPPDNPLFEKHGVDMEQVVRHTQDSIRINNAVNIVGIVVGAADVWVAYRDDNFGEVVFASALLALDIGMAVFEYQQQMAMLHNMSNASAQNLTRFGRTMKWWGKWGGPIMTIISSGLSFKSMWDNRDNPVKLRVACKNAMVNGIDAGAASLALFASPGVGQAVGIVYISWGAVSATASLMGVNPRAHDLVGSPTRAASTMAGYFFSNDIPSDYCGWAIDDAMADYYYVLEYKVEDRNEWVVPIWPPGMEP